MAKRGRPRREFTPEEQASVHQWMRDGTSKREIARRLGVPESTLRENFSAQSAQVKTVANQIVEAERGLAALPYVAQRAALDLAAQMQAATEHLMAAAVSSAFTASRLTRIAAQQAEELQDGEMPDETKMRALHALSMTSTEAAKIPMQLIAANKPTKSGQPGLIPAKANKKRTFSDFYPDTNGRH